MKKRFIKLISLILTVAITFQAVNITAFAETLYIKELKLFTSKDSSEAKQKCVDDGYILYDYDVNQDGGDYYVYLGYLTTSNPAEAITDIRVMNMGGGYVVEDGGELMAQMHEDLLHDSIYFMGAVNEFRANYYAGSELAKAAVNSMNICFMENGELLGDFILNTADAENMIDVLNYASSERILLVKSYISMGIGTIDGTSWIDRTGLIIEQDTAGEYTYSDKQMDDAYDVYDQVINFQDKHQEWLLGEKETDEDEEPAPEDLKDIDETFTSYYEIYFDILSSFEVMPGISMADYLLSPDFSIENAYPIAAALTEGELVMLNFVGFLLFADAASNAGDYTEINTVIEGVEKIDFWESSSRLDYNGPIAFTSEAIMEMKMEPSDSGISNLAIANIALGVLGGAAAIATMVAGRALYTAKAAVSDAVLVSEQAALRAATASAKYAERMAHFAKNGYSVNMAKQFAAHLSRKASREAAKVTVANASKVKAVTRASGVARGFVITLIIMVIIAAILATVNLVDRFSGPDIEDIPEVMVNVVEDVKTGRNTYIQYRVVQNQDGSPGNLNGVDYWNALYTTKDPIAGNPITANLLVQKNDQSTPNGYTNVSKFNREAAMSFNSNLKTKSHHYLFFKPSTESYFPASIFGDAGGLLLAGGGGLIVGVIVGGIFTGMFTKRRKAR